MWAAPQVLEEVLEEALWVDSPARVNPGCQALA
ncbi:hypothetical protein QF040_003815 [Variovorax sp. W2I14]